MKDFFKIFFFILIIFGTFFFQKSEAIEILSNEKLHIEFEKENIELANQIYSSFDKSKQHVINKLKLNYDEKVYILLCKNKKIFSDLTQIKIPSIQAIAVSSHNLIVVNVKTLRDTENTERMLEHEMTHLVLGYNINSSKNLILPRWFNEGVAQWASSGFNELFSIPYQDSLYGGFMTDEVIKFSSISYYFPSNVHELTLAYAQSLSFVEYLFEKYGEKKLIQFIHKLTENKENFYVCFEEVYNIQFSKVEDSWKNSRVKEYHWGYYIASHISSILYALIGFIAFIISVIVYFRNKAKKRKLYEEDEKEKEFLEESL